MTTLLTGRQADHDIASPAESPQAAGRDRELPDEQSPRPLQGRGVIIGLWSPRTQINFLTEVLTHFESSDRVPISHNKASDDPVERYTILLNYCTGDVERFCAELQRIKEIGEYRHNASALGILVWV